MYQTRNGVFITTERERETVEYRIQAGLRVVRPLDSYGQQFTEPFAEPIGWNWQERGAWDSEAQESLPGMFHNPRRMTQGQIYGHGIE